MAKNALFIGCTVAGRALNYELSTRNVAKALGVELVDIPEFACCGYPMANVDHEASMALAARNLALAEKAGADVITLCSACLGNLSKANKVLKEDDHERKAVNAHLAKLGLEFKGTSRVRHFMHVLYQDVGLENIRKAMKVDLSQMAVAPHYGCHYMKPHEIFEGLDNPINPSTLDELIRTTGARTVDYRYKLRCCGGGVLAIDENVPINLVGEKLKDVKGAGADMISLVCPFCAVMLDEYQATVEERKKVSYGIPVLYMPQLLGLGLGLDWKKDLMLNKNAVKTKGLLKAKGLVKGGDE